MPHAFDIVIVVQPFEWGGFWWAKADIHWLDEDIWFRDQWGRSDVEPTHQQMVQFFTTRGNEAAEDWLTEWGREKKRRIMQAMWDETARVGVVIFQEIINYPNAGIDQISQGVHAEVDPTAFDVKRLIQGIMAIFNFASFDDFKQWVIDHEDRLRGEWND
jgi:hypothetical protein